MVDTRYASNGNVRLRWYPANAFANYKWPTVAELNAGLRLEDAVPWDGFEAGVQASDTSSNPPLSAKSVVDTRGTSNYGGTIPIWYPGYYDDPSNQLSLIYDALDEPRTPGYIVMSIDGEIGEAGQPADTFAFAAGDLLTVMKVTTDSWEDMTEGDDPFYYTVGLLRDGGLAHYTVASTAAPAVVIPTALAISVGDSEVLPATVNARNYNGGLNWSTSAPAVATVSEYGVVTGVSAGAATITASIPGTNTPVTDTTAVTVS